MSENIVSAVFLIVVSSVGMCELIMINEDLDNEIKSDHKFSKKSLRLQHR